MKTPVMYHGTPNIFSEFEQRPVVPGAQEFELVRSKAPNEIW